MRDAIGAESAPYSSRARARLNASDVFRQAAEFRMTKFVN